MTSTPSIPQYMPSICQNIDVSRHVLVYRYIHDRANRMVENTTIRSYRCVCERGLVRACTSSQSTTVCGWHRPREQWWCVREVPRDRCNASEKRLVYSSPRGYSCRTPSVRYVSDGASFCTYTTVEKELVPWHMLHHGRENLPTLRLPGIVPHFETRTVNKFWARLVTFQITTTTTLYLIANLFTPITT